MTRESEMNAAGTIKNEWNEVEGNNECREKNETCNQRSLRLDLELEIYFLFLNPKKMSLN